MPVPPIVPLFLFASFWAMRATADASASSSRSYNDKFAGAPSVQEALAGGNGFDTLNKDGEREKGHRRHRSRASMGSGNWVRAANGRPMSGSWGSSTAAGLRRSGSVSARQDRCATMSLSYDYISKLHDIDTYEIIDLSDESHQLRKLHPPSSSPCNHPATTPNSRTPHDRYVNKDITISITVSIRCFLIYYDTYPKSFSCLLSAFFCSSIMPYACLYVGRQMTVQITYHPRVRAVDTRFPCV
ncbi:hypothetical protein EDC01DRAFT_243238 [Geopyxis carbonaria]|nr:hypothetical protein EDC01DRAFT_243238 [Geopyxis carbonaria]